MLRVRTLATRCLDLRFEKLSVNAMKMRMRQIAAAENLTVSDDVLTQIAETSGGDMRQCVGQLQMLSMQSHHQQKTKEESSAPTSAKDTQVQLGPFECCKLLLDSKSSSKLSVRDKMDLFFVDYDMIPLLIHVR
ncbi:BRCT domain containing protein, related [Eimeria praecox]|uniref:BRCT domain containing protein, related n=1 Tax=Eimeria praecox TaxID=51316 RepID=U6G779_9EIME|nr:BRCT domain containing protein, related [Eimeria praecox]